MSQINITKKGDRREVRQTLRARQARNFIFFKKGFDFLFQDVLNIK